MSRSELPGRHWYRRMVSRRPDESHRPATTLELFFDLCFVVAVAQAAGGLHHDLSENHIGHGVASYLFVFFALWWAWVNFTWFASAYDNDDVPYRLAVLVQIGGALIIAAGVSRAFADADYSVITLGYVVMRLALVAQWLRAARSDSEHRGAALRYALGVTAVQIGWILRLFLLPERWFVAGFLVLVVAELAVPAWAERSGVTTWHRGHISERYGLFTIIVLGESVLAATLAIDSALGTGHDATLFTLAAVGLVIVFAMWWLYFDQPAHELLDSLKRAIRWGYGHYLIFAAAAAVGAGLAVVVDYDTEVAHLSALAVGYVVAVPVAVYLLAVWVLHICPHQRGLITVAYPLTAALVLLTPLLPAPVHLIAVLMAALVATTVIAARRRAVAHSAS